MTVEFVEPTGTVATRSASDITESSSRVLLVAARRALAEADSLPEIMELAERSAVIRVAAERARLSRDAQNDWGEYKLDAERKAGLMLREMARSLGGRPTETSDSLSEVCAPPTYRDLGMGDTTASANQRAKRWQLLASLPDDEYEAFKAEVRADTEKVITQSAALAVAKHRQREQDKHDRATAEAAGYALTPTIRVASAVDWLATQADCDLLLTDPPYSTDVDDVEEFARWWLPEALKKVKPSGRAYVCIGAYPAELRAYLEKRSAALDRRDEGWLFPYLTVQAYCTEPRGLGRLLGAGIMRTVDLYSYAQPRWDQRKALRNPTDGVLFKPWWWAELKKAGLRVDVVDPEGGRS